MGGGGESDEESVAKGGQWVGFFPRDERISREGIDSLTTVRVFPSVRHAHEPFLINLPPSDTFISEFAAVDTCSARSIPGGDVSALDHKFIDDAVERGELIG